MKLNLKNYANDEVRLLTSSLIKKYGMEQFRLLLELFQRGESCAKVGYAFGVTRQRAHQWQAALGERTVEYRLHPIVEHTLNLELK